MSDPTNAIGAPAAISANAVAAQAEIVAHLDAEHEVKRAAIRTGAGALSELRRELAAIDARRVTEYRELLRLVDGLRAAHIAGAERRLRLLRGAIRRTTSELEALKSETVESRTALALDAAYSAEWLPMSEAAAALGVSSEWIRQWVRGRNGVTLPAKVIDSVNCVHVKLTYDHLRRYARRLPLGIKRPEEAPPRCTLVSQTTVTGAIRLMDFSDDALLKGEPEKKSRESAASTTALETTYSI